MQPRIPYTLCLKDGALPPTQPPGLQGSELAGVPTLPDQVIAASWMVVVPGDIEALGAAAIAEARAEILRRRLAKLAKMIGQSRMVRGWDLGAQSS